MSFSNSDKSKLYRHYKIPKNSGGYRDIHVPSKELALLQKDVLDEVLDKCYPAPYVHAFERAKNIPSMAQSHVGKSVVISLDINNFFGSVTQTRIYRSMRREFPMENPETLRWLSEVTTVKSFLPQGACTSPKISNVVVKNTFGPALIKLCLNDIPSRYRNDLEGEVEMTVYADDITMSFSSSSDGRTQRAIAKSIVNLTEGILKRYGFSINQKKTKIMYSGMRQYVCGVVVNKKVSLLRRDRDNLKALVHNCERNGIPREAARAKMEPEHFAKVYVGKLNWFAQVDPEKGHPLKDRFLRVVQAWQ